MLHATSHMVNAISYILRIKSSGGHALFYLVTLSLFALIKNPLRAIFVPITRYRVFQAIADFTRLSALSSPF